MIPRRSGNNSEGIIRRISREKEIIGIFYLVQRASGI